MAVFLGILVFVSIIACIASLMIIIIKAIMHKSVKKIKFIPIISIGVFIVSMFLSLTCFPQDESYIEYYPSYQHVYAIYNIFDCRFNKEYSIQSDDVVRIYGVITDIKTNYGNGLDYPVIDMYYADYIRQWNYQ